MSRHCRKARGERFPPEKTGDSPACLMKFSEKFAIRLRTRFYPRCKPDKPSPREHCPKRFPAQRRFRDRLRRPHIHIRISYIRSSWLFSWFRVGDTAFSRVRPGGARRRRFPCRSVRTVARCVAYAAAYVFQVPLPLIKYPPERNPPAGEDGLADGGYIHHMF